MKNSRKMKKFFVAFLAATLSIIMFATQVSASTPVTYSAVFAEEAEIVDAFEYMTWDPRRNWLTVGVDLTCYECDNVYDVYAKLTLDVYYPSSSNTSGYSESVSNFFTSSNTWDSDELLISITNFSRNYNDIGVKVEIQYMINYVNGDSELYIYEHAIEIIDKNINHSRYPTMYVYQYAEFNN